MNGGVVDCVGVFSKGEFRDALAGYRFFRLADAARVFEDATKLEPDHVAEAEQRLEDAFSRVIPTMNSQEPRSNGRFQQTRGRPTPNVVGQ